MMPVKHLAMAGACAVLSGCASYLVVADEPRYVGQPHEEGLSSIAWGAATNPSPGVRNTGCGEDEQIAMVRITRNFGQGLLNLITLGAVAPVTVEYRCASPIITQGETINTDDAPDE